MEVGKLAEVQAQKKNLKKKRDELIHKELRKRQKDKVNIDQSSLKKGFI